MNETVNNSKEAAIGFDYKIEEVFQEYYAPLCYFVSRYIVDELVIEDLVQDLFATLLEKKQTFNSSLHLKNFLYITLKNSCLNYLRKGNAKIRYELINEQNSYIEESLIQNIIATEVYKELAEAVAQLPPKCRRVFEASYFDGLDNMQVANKLGISIFTVKAQKVRGKKILKENLKDLFPVLAILFDIY